MPSYEFNCTKCNKIWDEFLNVSDREAPISKACPHCKKKKCVQKHWMGTSLAISSDATLTPNKATGGRWNDLMAKMKSGLPKRYARRLDKPNNMSGRSWKG